MKTHRSGLEKALAAKANRDRWARGVERAKERAKESGEPHFTSSPAWRKLRKQKLLADPFCEDCLDRDREVLAREVHHIEKRADRPDLALAWLNLRSLCKPCHSRRTLRGE